MEAIFVAYAAASVIACLPGIYWVTAPDWYRNSAGRALMMLLASLATVFVLIVATGLFGEYPYRELVRYIVYSAVLVAAVRLAILFMQLRFGPNQGYWVEDKPPK